MKFLQCRDYNFSEKTLIIIPVGNRKKDFFDKNERDFSIF